MSNKIYDYECPQCGEYIKLKYNKNAKYDWEQLEGHCSNCHLPILMSIKEWEDE